MVRLHAAKVGVPAGWDDVLRMMTLLSVKSMRAPGRQSYKKNQLVNGNMVVKPQTCLGGLSRVFPTRQPACGGAWLGCRVLQKKSVEIITRMTANGCKKQGTNLRWERRQDEHPEEL